MRKLVVTLVVALGILSGCASGADGGYDAVIEALEASERHESADAFSPFLDPDGEVELDAFDETRMLSSESEITAALQNHLPDAEVVQSTIDEEANHARVECRVRVDESLLNVSMRFYRDGEEMILHRIRIRE